jgi:hypothetical protein
MESTKGTTRNYNLTISEAQDMMQDLKLAIANAVQDFADQTGLWVYLNGGPNDDFSRHVIQIQVQVPGSKG